ncbi:MAG: UbiA family prenyltransferase [Deltaproteobacteria bacterium]|nr:UbiA family prenyltransferase [Deltaproteobacteria bacterium]
MSARCPVLPWNTFIELFGSLFLAISGSTVLNMVYDRNIDARMNRTAHRPIPSGKISVNYPLYMVLSFLRGCFLMWLFIQYG